MKDLQQLLGRLKLEACFYGHAASGLLHVRPVLDLHASADVRKFRILADEVSYLVRQYKGSLAAEHGVGMARTEFMKQHLGAPLLQASWAIKKIFDTRLIFNPGKILGGDCFKIDTRLRQGPDNTINLPFTPRLAFAARDESLVANLEQCNGCGGCRKDAPTMCPTYQATGEEIMSTRGRANAIRAVLEQRCGAEQDPMASTELDLALSNCLACKACTTECPSNVNLSLLKAELLNARHQRHGLPMSARLISAVDSQGVWGCRLPGLANGLLAWRPLRRWMSRFLGITDQRPLPSFARQRFDHWFRQRPVSMPGAEERRGQVILWDDTFTRYYDPHIGQTAVKVLEAAGDLKCCFPGTAAAVDAPLSAKETRVAADPLGRHNLKLLVSEESLKRLPIIFLEPSCYSMFAEDYLEMNLPYADEVKARSFLFEHFLDQLLEKNPEAIQFYKLQSQIAIHAHCHAKALLSSSPMIRLAERITSNKVQQLLETGCCGMAGAFGSLEDKYDLSVRVATPLLEQIDHQPRNTRVVASGTSCRHQIEHLSRVRPTHMAELVAEALQGRERLGGWAVGRLGGGAAESGSWAAVSRRSSPERGDRADYFGLVRWLKFDTLRCRRL